MSMLAVPNFLRGVASLLYPPSCTICAASVDLDEYLCPECEAKVSRIVPPFCAKCSEPFDGAITTSFACVTCAHRTLHFEAAVSANRDRGRVRVLLIDDVLTTGSPLSECARTLKEAGAQSVYAATAARA